MPVYAEIMKLLGFKSKNSVYKLINKLVDEGVVLKDSKGRLLPASNFDEIPLLGLVEAGFPSATEEQLTETVSLDDLLIRHRDSTYLLEVKGDSMIDEGIKEGDLVIVERKGEPKDGDIVIAEFDHGWTMKYYRKRNGKIYLEAANKKYGLMFPKEELKVAAIVKGVIRKY